MIPIETILHPTDFSENAAAGLTVARSLARDHGARLILLHVAPAQGLAAMSWAPPDDPRMFADPLDALRAQVEGVDLKCPVQTEIRHGEAAEEICKAADELGCDLIVMGTHGRTALSRLLMGSVAEAVLRHASVQVLTVRTKTSATVASDKPEPVAILDLP